MAAAAEGIDQKAVAAEVGIGQRVASTARHTSSRLLVARLMVAVAVVRRVCHTNRTDQVVAEAAAEAAADDAAEAAAEAAAEEAELRVSMLELESSVRQPYRRQRHLVRAWEL